MQKFKRRQLLVDPQVQGALLWRTVFYWAASICAVTLLLFIWRTIAAVVGQNNDATAWSYAGPALVTMVFLLPAFAFDFLRLSNQLVGPIFRLRRTVRKALAGERVQPIKFREGDFWQDFADEINALLRKIDELERAAPSAPLEEVASATTT